MEKTELNNENTLSVINVVKRHFNCNHPIRHSLLDRSCGGGKT